MLLEVRPGIESNLKKPVKLGRNYRVTEDVLKVSNVSENDMLSDAESSLTSACTNISVALFRAYCMQQRRAFRTIFNISGMRLQ